MWITWYVGAIVTTCIGDVLLTIPPLDSLKSSIEQRRIAMAVQGLVHSDVAEFDPKEEELKRLIESEKERLVKIKHIFLNV